MIDRYVARAIITDEKNKVLLGERARGVGKGQLALIGGKKEDNETLEEALIREVKEELDVEVIGYSYFTKTITTIFEPGNWHTSYFETLTKGTPHPHPQEIKRIVYLTEEELEGADIAFDHKTILREYFESKNRD